MIQILHKLEGLDPKTKGIRSDIWMEDMRNSMELCWKLCREKLLREQQKSEDSDDVGKSLLHAD